MTDWWHRTCSHRVPQIEAAGVLTPHRQPALGSLEVIWLTASRHASRADLGLSSHSLSCDRMEHLYRVDPEDAALVLRWGDVKRAPDFAPFLPAARRLDAAHGTRPGLWGVAFVPLRVVASDG